MLKLILLACFITVSQQIKIKEFEVPKSVHIDEKCELKCSYELEPGEKASTIILKWSWMPDSTHPEDKKLLYQHVTGAAPRIVAHNIHVTVKENDTIVLSGLRPKDSGVWECGVEHDDVEDNQLSEMIVYSKGTGPLLNISLVADGPDEDQEEDVLVSCEAEDVSPEPDLAISVGGLMQNTNTTLTPLEDGLYDISAMALVSKSEANGMDIRCELFYLNSNLSHPAFIASNIYNRMASVTEPAVVPSDAQDLASSPSSQPGHAVSIFTHSISTWLLLVLPTYAILSHIQLQ